MKVTHLASVAVTAPEPEQLVGFYANDWGLSDAGTVGDAAYLRGADDEHFVLSVSPAPTSRLVGYRLGLADAGAVDAAAQDLRLVAGIVIVDQPHELDTPGGGYGFTVADPDGRLIELVARGSSAGALPARPGAPLKVSHIVVNSPDADGYGRFLVEALGFELADEMPHMSFYRCNADHHSIAVTRAPHASLNHIAFELANVEDVLHGVDRLQDTTPLIWGPNRHGPGNNVFAYFAAPNGQVIEYTAEVQRIDPDDPPAPRLWLPEDGKVVDDWAKQDTLRPTPQAREAMLGEPEPPLASPSHVAAPGGAR